MPEPWVLCGLPGGARALALSPDESLVAVLGDEGGLSLRRMPGGETLALPRELAEALEGYGEGLRLAFPDDDHLVAAGPWADGGPDLRLLRVSDGAVLGAAAGQGLALAADGTRTSVCTLEGAALVVLDAPTLARVAAVELDAECHALSGAGASVAVATATEILRVDAGSREVTLRWAIAGARHLALTEEGEVLASDGSQLWHGDAQGAVAIVPAPGDAREVLVDRHAGGRRAVAGDLLLRREPRGWRYVRRLQTYHHLSWHGFLSDGRLLGASSHWAAAAEVPALPGGPGSRPGLLVGDPTGRWLAVASDGLALVYERATERLAQVLDAAQGDLDGLAFSADGARIFTAFHTGIAVWDTESGRLVDVWRYPERYGFDRLCLDRAGATLAAGAYQRALLVDARSGAPRLTLGPFGEDEETECRDIDLAPCGRWVAIGVGYGDGVELFDGASGARLRRIPGAAHPRFVGAGDTLLVARDGVGARYALPSLEPLGGPAWIGHEAAQALGDEEGRTLSVGQSDTLALYGRDEERWELEFTAGVRAAWADGRSETLYTAMDDGWIATRELSRGALRSVIQPAEGARPTALALDPRGAHVAVGDDQGRIAIWRLAGAESARILFVDPTPLGPGEPGSPGEVSRLWFVQGEDDLALWVARGSSLVELVGWLGQEAETEAALPEGAREIEIAGEIWDLDADGRRVLVAGSWEESPTVIAIGADSDERVCTLPPRQEYGVFGRLSPDGAVAVLGLAEGDQTELVAHDVATGAALEALEIGAEVEVCAFHPDGALVMARAGYEGPGTLARWVIGDDEALGGRVERWGHPARGEDAARAEGLLFSRDGSVMLAWGAAGLDGVVVREGRAPVALAAVFSQRIDRAALSADGRCAAVADFAGRVRVWDTERGTLLVTLCSTGDGGEIVSAGEAGGPTRRRAGWWMREGR